MIIMGLDPAATTGWAYSHGRWGIERFIKRPWRHPFAHYLDFRAWLVERVETLKIEAIAVESVLSTPKFMGNGQRHEWHGIVLSVAAECDLIVAQVMPSSLKKYATGNGRAERSDMRTALKDRFNLDLAEEEHDAIAAIWVLSWVTNEANEGRLTREWSGFPKGAAVTSRGAVCNRCCKKFRGGLKCPRCGSQRTRLEA